MKLMNILAAVVAFALLAGCGSDEKVEVSDDQAKAIAERIAPAGEVAMEGDPKTAPVVAAASSGEARSGKVVYDTKCFACHTTGAAGAPKIGDAAVWESRLAQGIETVYTHAIKGINAMPPKGTCMDCSDDEIKAAVDYMIAGG